jgi:glycosyltransferase involved in cell wall biosynthesis
MNKYFLYVGNAYPHKNLKRLFEAMVSLNENSNEKVILKISSGKSAFTKRLEDLIKSLNAGEYIELLGFVPDERLTELYRNSVAFVFPSLSEGFGLPGIEAMEAGTLVLASDIPVFREIYKDAAIYFNPLDFTSIQKSMETALEMSDADRKEKVAYSQKFVKRYSWEKMAKDTLRVYLRKSGNTKSSLPFETKSS